jgi:hypothetical protein
MPKDNAGSRLTRWYHDNFHNWFFRSLLGPAQTENAVHGADQGAREQWKRDLDSRKRYSREQRDRKRARIDAG